MEEEIKVLMRSVDMILAARKDTVDILRTQPICNVQTISRASKNLKDPNPLSTAMKFMSTKYPLAIDKKKALSYNMPDSLVCYGKGGEDTHYHGRVLAKLESIDWWVSKSDVPKQSIVEVIDILHKKNRDEVSKYFNMKWKNTVIKLGTAELERRAVETQRPLVRVDRSQRANVISNIMLPSHTNPCNIIPSFILEPIAESLSLSSSAKLALGPQMRILLNAMDPKVRVLPIPPGFEDVHTTLRHALYQPTFMIVNVPNVKEEQVIKDSRILDNFGEHLHKVSIQENLATRRIREIIRKAKYRNFSIPSILENISCTETNGIKWLRGAMGMPITMESRSGAFITSPQIAKISIKTCYNKTGAKYSLYMGRETVNFKFNEMRGNFSHDGAFIYHIKSNFTLFNSLVNLIGEIGSYCRFNFNETTARTLEGMRIETRKLLKKYPHLLIQCTSKQFEIFKRPLSLPIKIGKLTLVESSEYTPQSAVVMTLDKDYNLSNESSQTITFQTTKSIDNLPDEFVTEEEEMFDSLGVRRNMMLRHSYYIYHFKTLIQKIEEGIWNWRNESITKKIGTIAPKISQATRVMIEKHLVEPHDKEIVCFAYLFTGCVPSQSLPLVWNYTLPNNIVIDLLGNSGCLYYDKEKGAYYIFGKETSVKRNDISKLWDNKLLLDGYSINEISGKETYPLRSVFQLENSTHLNPVGASFMCFISGTPYKVIRDPNVSASRIRTINRHINERDLKNSNFRTAACHRLWEGVSKAIPEEEAIPKKRRKIEELIEEDSEVDDYGDLELFHDDSFVYAEDSS